MSCRPPLEIAYRTGIVGRSAGVHQDTVATDRKFKGQRIGMSVSWLIVGTKRGGIKQDHDRPIFKTHVAAVGQRAPYKRHSHAGRVELQGGEIRRDIMRRIVKECDLSIRMR